MPHVQKPRFPTGRSRIFSAKSTHRNPVQSGILSRGATYVVSICGHCRRKGTPLASLRRGERNSGSDLSLVCRPGKWVFSNLDPCGTANGS